MFEKLPAARMNDSEKPPTERLIAGACELGDKQILRDSSMDFPSYLRLFATFFELLSSESHWEAARLWAGRCGQFPAAQPHVAFV